MNIGTLLSKAARTYPENLAIARGASEWTYARFNGRVNQLANALFRLGIRQGDNVALLMFNCPEMLESLFACFKAGCGAVPINFRLHPREFAFIVDHSESRALIISPEFDAAVAGVRDQIPRVQHVIAVSGAREGAMDYASLLSAESEQFDDEDVAGEEVAWMFYTSGTTGFPKGAQLTHRGCVSNLYNMLYARASSALAVMYATGEVPPDPPPVPVTLINTPLFHVTANNCAAYAVTAAGGKMVLMYKWDAGEALRLIEKHRIMTVSGVPVMARELINHPDFDKTDTSSLMALGGGGAQVPPDLVLKIEEKVATARPNTGYGMTETCGIITSVAADFYVDRPDSAGPAMPSYEAKCVDPDGNEVPQGETGELWVRGSSVIKGYINRPDATAETITDGWLHTGDIARIDEDGFIYIVDRKKDMVLRGGENIYCAEVEAGLYRHPAVAECSVFGLPDERLGEEVAAAIVAKPGETLSEDAIREHCLTIMAKHKVPRFIWILDEALPRNASGKFLKRDLKEQLLQQLAQASS